MRRLKFYRIGWVGIRLTVQLLLSSGVYAAGGNKTLSPYFQVVSENPHGLELLPLQHTAANVDITGVIADVRVTQTYQNRRSQPIDAIYVFPGSTGAADYALQMMIGEHVVKAKIKERQAARTEYTQAKQQGKRASLLEQQRPNVFQVNVANIMPGDKVKWLH